MTVHTADGERLAAWHVPPPAAGPVGVGVLVAHGFSGSLERDEVQAIGRAFAAYGAVLLLSHRGHGASTGFSTLGDREVLDVDAAVRTLRELGADRVVTTGWSMGGSAVLRQAGLVGTAVHGHVVLSRPDAVVVVSTTSRWYATVEHAETVAMRRLHRLVETRLGRLVSGRMGARVDPAGWDRAAPPVTTLAAAGRVALPLLVVHGDSDHYLGADHGRALVAAAGPTAELWEVPGLGHAEQAVARDPELLARLVAYLPVLLARRRA